MVDRLNLRRINASIFLLLIVTFISFMPAREARASARNDNRVCQPFVCSKEYAKEQCDGEIALARQDPGFADNPQRDQWYCSDYFYGNVWIISFPGNNGFPQDVGFNDYQNGFYFDRDGTHPQTDKNAGSCACPAGDPINTGTGNKFESEVLYPQIGGSPLSLTLTYNNHAPPPPYYTTQHMFGRNRGSTYSRHIRYYTSASPAVLRLFREDNKVLRFTYSGTAWVADQARSGEIVDIVSNGIPAGWRFTDNSGTQETYSIAGDLVSVTDTSGHTLTLSYGPGGKLSTVTDGTGRSMTFDVGSDGLVTVVHFPDGKTLQFFYTSDQDLQRIQFQDGLSRTFAYDEAAYVPDHASSGMPLGALTGTFDESNQRTSTTTYSKSPYTGFAQAIGTTLAGGASPTSLQYADYNPASSVDITTPDGANQHLTFSVQNGVVMPAASTTTCTVCVTQSTSYIYDSNWLPDITTRNGVDTDHDYNARGLLTQQIDASNDTTGKKRTTQTDWHPTFRVPTERRLYDASNALVSKSTWTYNARGQALTSAQTDPATGTSRTTTTTYCEPSNITAGSCPLLGLVTSVDGPRTDVSDLTTYTYYPSDDASCASAPTTCPHRKGDLWKVTNALGQVSETLAYDGAGRVLSMKDANGVVTDLDYHPRGWLTASKVRGTDNAVETDDRITRIDYWPTGLVKQVTQPDGAFTGYTYDAAHRLTDITDNTGNTVHYTLDNAGNRLNEDTKDSTGTLKRTLSRVYNQLGQLATQADASGHPTDLTYDANGNPDTVTDALGRVTDSDHDPLNRLTRTLQDVGGINAETTFAYDAQDHLTQVTDPKGLDTTYAYSGLGDLTRLTSPDTGITNYTYDSAGNRRTQTDARGKVSTYSYDALNRLTQVAYPNTGLNATYTYDTPQTACASGETFSTGRLTKLTDASGSTQYCYDRFGQLLRKVQTTNAKAFTVRYAYTRSGQLSRLTYPDGAVVDYVRDAQGRITEVGTQAAGGVRQVLLNQVGYYPFGPASGWVYGNGRSLLRTYNQNYQPERIHDASAGGLSTSYGFDAVGQLTALKDGTQTTPLAGYDYDALSRLTKTKDGVTGTPIETYGYDATGNRTSLLRAGTTTAYTYPATSHRTSNVGGVARSYDAAGNTTQIGGTARQFIYSDAGRLGQVKAGSAVTMNYQYNGRGEQVRRYPTTMSTAQVYTVYDEAGQWLGDYDSTGATLQQAVWLDDQPVGLLAGATTNQTLHYVEPDHLGTPRVVIEQARNVAIWRWDATGEAFGNTAPNQDPDGDGTAFVFDLRMAGQKYDSASGLSQNGFRDYEAATGRYPQSDPIGLNGGVSTYGYAGNSPLKNIDPNGLMWFGPTCSAAQRAAITSEITQLANEISDQAKKATNGCLDGNCDFQLAADVMRWIAREAYFSCDRTKPCAEIYPAPPYISFYPPLIGAPDSAKISAPGVCGCFRSAIFHEAAHVVRWEIQDDDIIRRKTLDCVSCGTNVRESGGPL